MVSGQCDKALFLLDADYVEQKVIIFLIFLFATKAGPPHAIQCLNSFREVKWGWGVVFKPAHLLLSSLLNEAV